MIGSVRTCLFWAGVVLYATVTAPVSATYLVEVPPGEGTPSMHCPEDPPPIPFFGGNDHSGSITPNELDGTSGDPQPFTMKASGFQSDEYQSGTVQVGSGFFSATGTYEAWIDDEGVMHLEATITVPGLFSSDTYNISLALGQDGKGRHCRKTQNCLMY